jgi:pSer/pThr/pTyr-binding forkhead associated (FHA) protein
MAASFSLIIEDDAGKQIVVPFSKDVMTIGRKEGNTIRLTERNVSRFHAKLMKDNGGVFVEDLSSFNGIKLNGDRISGTVPVNSGDVLEIGDYHLELRAAQTANVGPIGSKSVAVGVGDDDDADGTDEFEGETQRWDAPAPQPVAARTPLRTPDALASHGGFGGDGGDTERLDMSRLQALASGGQLAAPPPELPPPQSWPAPPRPPAPSAPAAMLDLEPTARQPIAGVPFGATAPFAGAPSGPPSGLLADNERAQLPAAAAPHAPSGGLQDATPARHAPLRDLIADRSEAVPAPSLRSAPPAAAPGAAAPPAAAHQAPAAAGPASSGPPLGPVASMPPAPTSARPAPQRNFEETEQMRPAPGRSANDGALDFPRLIALNTIFAGVEFPLKGMENVLGRTDDNDIIVEHRSISRNHAKFVRQGDRVQVLDLKSSNGTLVNGEEVDQHTLRSGDVIELGRVQLRFVPIGERFALSADEVERARVADETGDDFEEGAKTSMFRQAVVTATPQPARPVALYALLGLLGIVVVVLTVLLLLRGGSAAPSPGAQPPATAATSTGSSAPATAAPAARAEGSAGATVAERKVVTAGSKPADTASRGAEQATAAAGPLGDPTLTSPQTGPTSSSAPAPLAKPASASQTAVRPAAPLNLDAASKRVVELYTAGKIHDAISVLKEMDKQDRGNPQHKQRISLYYAKIRNAKSAIEYYHLYKKAEPNQANIRALHGLLSKHGVKVDP